MNNIIEGKYLPIGSVVLLKGGSKRVMITGFCVVDVNNSSKLFDYCGCLYPEGLLKTDQAVLFNHEQIDKIYYLGYRDQEEINFKSRLNELIAKSNSASSISNDVNQAATIGDKNNS